MPKIILDQVEIVAAIGNIEAVRVAEHVRADRQQFKPNRRNCLE